MDCVDLAFEAFAGKEAFLLECAIATDFLEPPLPRRKRPSTYVYFIGPEHGPIKIGSARDPYERLLNLQVASADQLYIYAVADGGYEAEKDLHREFASERIRGEWYRRSERLLRRIVHLQSLERSEISRLSTQGEERRGN